MVDDAFIVINQVIVYVLISRILRHYFRADRNRPASIYGLRRGSLIVANHQSILDPFIILAHLPFRSFLNVIPVRFPTSHAYYSKLSFLAGVGAYDIGADKRERMLGLFRTRKYLIDGKSVMLFPEGKISPSRSVGMSEFQEGITFLTDVARRSVFVRMDGFHQSEWLKIWSARRSMAFSEVQSFQGEAKDARTLRECMERLSL